MALLRRRELPLARFERREGVIVPQTASHVAVHADVCFQLALAPGARAEVEEAFLRWEVRSPRAATLARLAWDRAVIGGRFLYPRAAIVVDATSQFVTLTFSDGLIRHDSSGPPPRESVLVAELRLAGAKGSIERDLWRVTMTDWLQPAVLHWQGD